MRLLVINGPNLNFLGIRERGIYGDKSYSDLLDLMEKKAKELNIDVEVFQSNGEGEIIDRIQRAYNEEVDGIIINPAAYTHYSYAIRDALASIRLPKLEVHISNILEREEFRHISVTAPVCDGQIMGHGLEGYLMAMEQMVKLCNKE
jgi:3-dehydroquinate dehydratase-2